MKTINKTADYLARVALIQCGVRQYNDTVFSAPSATENKNHILTVIDGVVTYCSQCKGFQFYGECAHSLAVLGFIAEEQRTLAEAAVKAAEQIVSEASTVEVVPTVKYFTKEEMQARRDAERICRDAGYTFRLLGRWDYWTPQYRKDAADWQNIPGVEKPICYPMYAEKALDEFTLTLAAQLRKEQKETVPVSRRGYLTRPAGVRRDEKYGIILR